MSHFVIPVTYFINFLPHFLIIWNSRNFLFLPNFAVNFFRKDQKRVCKVFLSQLVIHTIITKNLYNIQILVMFGKKTKKNCTFNMKLVTQINLNMLKSIRTFLFSVLNGKYYFQQNLVKKFIIAHISWTCPYNSNMLNLMIMLTFSVLDWKYHFWVNLDQKFRIASLSWNFVPAVFWMCWVRSWCWLFCLRMNIPLLGKFGPKKSKLSA